MASANVYRGVGVRGLFNGAALEHDQISIDMTVDDIPAVGFEDVSADGFTYDDGAMGIVGHALSGSGYWDASLNPHNAGPGFKPGLYLAGSVFLAKPNGPGTISPPNQANARSYGYPVLRCLGGRTTAQIRGRVDFNYNVKSCGAVIYPV